MNLLHAVIAFFKKREEQVTNSGLTGFSYDLQIEAYIARHLKEINDKVPQLEEIYGKDFYSFFYKPDADIKIRKELLAVIGFTEGSMDCLDNNHWTDKHPFNFPGTFYTCYSDSCGTGDSEAPFNVLYDGSCLEYVFKQPRSYAELLCVIDAGAVEALDSYSCNGNDHWTYGLCKDWWANRGSLMSHLYDAELQRMNGGREKMYIDYLQSEAETDLRKYCYFLEHHHYPVGDHITLPDL